MVGVGIGVKGEGFRGEKVESLRDCWGGEVEGLRDCWGLKVQGGGMSLCRGVEVKMQG